MLTKIFQDRSAVLQKSKTLRGSHIVISEDFPRDVMIKRRHLIKFAKQVRLRSQSSITDATVVSRWNYEGLTRDVFLSDHMEAVNQFIRKLIVYETWCGYKARISCPGWRNTSIIDCFRYLKSVQIGRMFPIWSLLG